MSRVLNKSINIDARTKDRFEKARNIYKPHSKNNVFLNYLLDIFDQYPSDKSEQATETEESQSSR